MYTAELFAMANDPKAVKEVFLNNVTLSIEDDAPGCIDLDAEKERLSNIGLSQTAFAKQAGIPRRTVQDWCGEKRACPTYVRFLLAEHYGLL